MVKRKKENEEFEQADDVLEHLQAESEPEKPKVNKALDKLYNEVAVKWNVLNKFLTEQGLGQNARGKVTKMVNELHAIRVKIEKEEE